MPSKPSADKAGEARRERPRILIVFDGEAWFVRKVRLIEHDLSRDEKVYRCDEHLGGPHKTLGSAVADAELLIHPVPSGEKEGA